MNTDEEEAAQRAWELDMEAAMAVRGRTRSRSILGESPDEIKEEKDEKQDEEQLNTETTSRPRRTSSNSSNSGLPYRSDVDIIDSGHDPNWLDEGRVALSDNISRHRSRSFAASGPPDLSAFQPKQDPPEPPRTRRRSCSFSTKELETYEDKTENQDRSQDDIDQIVRRAASLSKIYLVGSAPVDVSKLQDEEKIRGGKKVEVTQPTGKLSAQALDALSEGLQLSVEQQTANSMSLNSSMSGNRMSRELSGGMSLHLSSLKDRDDLTSSSPSYTSTIAIGRNDIGNSANDLSCDINVETYEMTEEEREEKELEQEENEKLQEEKLSTRRPLKHRMSSLFTTKVFKSAGLVSTPKALPAPPPRRLTGGSGPAAAAGMATAATERRSSANRESSHSRTHQMGGNDGKKDTPAVRPKKPHKLKLLLLGDSGVGKTSLLRVFSGDEFSESMLATAGVDFRLRHVAIDEEEIALQIWDTAGQERFHRITSTYYKGANGIVLVYDISDQRGFDNVGYWMANIAQFSSPKLPAMLLVGNKIDLPNRVVSSEQGRAAAMQYNCRFIETSAKTSANTNGALETIARDAYYMSTNPMITQKMLLERKSKDNCAIS